MCGDMLKYTRLDFFLCGCVRDCIYQNSVHDLATLHTRIVEAVETVHVDMLKPLWKEIEYRLHIVKQLEVYM